MENIGDAGTGGYSFVGYYLSTDETITTRDHYLGYDFVGVLAEGVTNIQEESFHLNKLNIEDGDYYVGAVADFTSRLGESDLSNNACHYDNILVRIGQVDEAEEGECAQFNFNDFEDGKLGVWTDGGEHAFINAGTTFAASGTRSMAIRGDKANKSSIYTSAWIEKGGFTELKISFNYYAFLMESGDSFVLEVDTGSGYSIAKEWKAGIDFESAKSGHIEMTLPLHGDVKLKFRCKSSHTYEYVFLDDILIERCLSESNLLPEQASANSLSIEGSHRFDVELYPNPIAPGESFSLSLSESYSDDGASVYLFDSLGRLLRQDSMQTQMISIGTDGLKTGSYVVVVVSGEERVVRKLLVH